MLDISFSCSFSTQHCSQHIKSRKCGNFHPFIVRRKKLLSGATKKSRNTSYWRLLLEDILIIYKAWWHYSKIARQKKNYRSSLFHRTINISWGICYYYWYDCKIWNGINLLFTELKLPSFRASLLKHHFFYTSHILDILRHRSFTLTCE